MDRWRRAARRMKRGRISKHPASVAATSTHNQAAPTDAAVVLYIKCRRRSVLRLLRNDTDGPLDHTHSPRCRQSSLVYGVVKPGISLPFTTTEYRGIELDRCIVRPLFVFLMLASSTGLHTTIT